MTDRIGQLYRIEADIRGKDPATRRAVLQKLSKRIVDALRPWLEAQLEMLPSNSDLARHIRYGLKRWDGLTRFLGDGRIEMDTNAPLGSILRMRLPGNGTKTQFAQFPSQEKTRSLRAMTTVRLPGPAWHLWSVLVS